MNCPAKHKFFQNLLKTGFIISIFYEDPNLNFLVASSSSLKVDEGKDEGQLRQPAHPDKCSSDLRRAGLCKCNKFQRKIAI